MITNPFEHKFILKLQGIVATYPDVYIITRRANSILKSKAISIIRHSEVEDRKFPRWYIRNSYKIPLSVYNPVDN